MIPVRLDSLRKDYGSTVAVAGVSLEAFAGGLTFLLGPSGCGKTTILRMIAGFLEPTGGRILFGDRDITAVPAEKRDCGMVFQSYALWPHLTVEQNVAFGLEVRKEPAEQIRRRVGEALEMVRMGQYAQRRPNQLSGGQQQRVALARAIVYRPQVLLLDEPLSNLDAKLRLEMRGEIRRIVDETRVTAIYVTHDQKESLSLADRMVVLRDGRIEQLGAPREMYDRPTNAFVAEFLGETNFLTGTLEGGAAATRRVDTPAGALETATAGTRAGGSPCLVSVRPESLRMAPAASVAPDAPALRGSVVESVYLGEVAQHRVECAGVSVKVFELNPRSASRRGESVALTVDPAQVVILDAAPTQPTKPAVR
ncbi:MAG: ABC transporter ATP-binding protein [Phycisphaerales bacterium]